MKTGKSIPMLVLIALAAAVLGFVMGSDDAHAATKPCTSSQASAIQSQQRVVDQKQRTVNQDQQSYNTAQQKVNAANVKVADLSAKRDASKSRIASLLASAAKNVKSPSVARGYQSQAATEVNNLNSIEQRLKWAQQEQKTANTDAANKLSKLSRSQRDLGSAQDNLASKRRQCV